MIGGVGFHPLVRAHGWQWRPVSACGLRYLTIEYEVKSYERSSDNPRLHSSVIRLTFSWQERDIPRRRCSTHRRTQCR